MLVTSMWEQMGWMTCKVFEFFGENDDMVQNTMETIFLKGFHFCLEMKI